MVEALVPRRLGSGFRWLWSASSAGNVADGILLAAAPLLVARLTDDAFPVALAVFLQRLPWLLFSLLAGALIDRVDRLRLTVAVYGMRAATVGLLAVAVAADRASLTAVYAVTFLLGTAETVADNASNALVPEVVPDRGLGLANARLVASQMVANQLVGPPVGAFLFSIGLVLPFGAYAVAMAAGAVLLTRTTRLAHRHVPPERRAVRHEVAEGVRWLWHHPPVRTLALTIAGFNITFGAAISVLVLLAQQRLGLGDRGYGLLLAASAVGGVVGAVSYGHLERRFSLGTLMRGGLIIETLTHLGLALVTSSVAAGVVLLVFGAHAAVWGTTSTTVRQRGVPPHLQGRVSSVYGLGSLGGIAIGSVLGGVLAQRGDITTPYWFAFGGSVLMTVLLWRQFPLIAHAADDPSATE